MKRMVMMLVAVLVGWTSSVMAAGGPIPIDLRKQLYELHALMDVTALQIDMVNQDNTWQDSAKTAFVDGEASLEMGIGPGPGNYRGNAWWNDKWGCPIKACTDYKFTTFQVGVNIKDFPVLLCEDRMLHFTIEGPASSDGVWVNGRQAQYSDGYWHVLVNKPWAIDELKVIWNGHGSWSLPVNESSDFGDAINLVAGGMNPNQDTASQMSAISYSGENSWVWGVSSYMYNDVDDQGNVYAEFAANIPDGTKIMVFFCYWEPYLGTIVEYHNTTAEAINWKPEGLAIRVPLNGTWFDQNQTMVRFVYPDANGVMRQTWVNMVGNG